MHFPVIAPASLKQLFAQAVFRSCSGKGEPGDGKHKKSCFNLLPLEAPPVDSKALAADIDSVSTLLVLLPLLSMLRKRESSATLAPSYVPGRQAKKDHCGRGHGSHGRGVFRRKIRRGTRQQPMGSERRRNSQ